MDTVPQATPAHPFHRLRVVLRSLYRGDSPTAVRFRFGVILVDLAIIAFFIAGPMMRGTAFFLSIDYLIAAILGIDLVGGLRDQPGAGIVEDRVQMAPGGKGAVKDGIDLDRVYHVAGQDQRGPVVARSFAQRLLDNGAKRVDPEVRD